jgi:biofilm PGA synthesis N-glycosyltransferase PgaC
VTTERPNDDETTETLVPLPSRFEDQILAELEPERDETTPVVDVVVLIPAHNEETWIQRTIGSLYDQSYPVKRILVMADNCTDRTVELARAAGAEVHETVDNTHRKAGAMNQGFAMLLPALKDTDVVMGMDADGVIKEDAIEIALEIFKTRPDLGGVSGSVRTRKPTGWLETAQVLEYERGRRIMSRAKGRIHVLSGAAAFIKVGVLRHVAESRGSTLPGTRGEVMMAENIVEDYELTLAVQRLGYKVTSSKRCQMFSDLMPTIRELEGQRMRWYRGTIETLFLYGIKDWHTFRTAGAILFNLFTSTLMALAYLMLAVGWLAVRAEPDFRFFLLTPLFLAEYVIVAHKVPGRWPKIVAYTFFPMWIYGHLLFLVYWRSAWHALRKRDFHWGGDQQDRYAS